MKHEPVLLQEILDQALFLKEKTQVRVLDGTVGRAGHLKALAELLPQAELVGFDQDPQALKEVRETWDPGRNLQLVHANFSSFNADQSGLFDFILVDLGVSSPQLDEAVRGFSFYHDGPLDMRMNNSQGPTAADLVNELSESELLDIFREYGEVYHGRRVAQAIVQRRKQKPFQSTLDLAHLIESTDGWRRKGFHPATAYFMALRIATNAELDHLVEALPRLRAGLAPGGRLAVLTFHSLEDRIVKNDFRSHPEDGKPLFKKVIVPTREECLRNPRSRSAKLRVFERSRDAKLESRDRGAEAAQATDEHGDHRGDSADHRFSAN